MDRQDATARLDPAERLVDALDRVLMAGVDLSQPRRTSARMLTVSARVSVGRRNGPEWLSSTLDQLTAQWHAEDGERS